MNMTNLEITWLKDIFSRIAEVNNSKNYNAQERQDAINWLYKQALKVDRE